MLTSLIRSEKIRIKYKKIREGPAGMRVTNTKGTSETPKLPLRKRKRVTKSKANKKKLLWTCFLNRHLNTDDLDRVAKNNNVTKPFHLGISILFPNL